MEKSFDRLVARVAIMSTVDDILAQAEMRHSHTHTHCGLETLPAYTDADVDVALLPLTYADTYAHLVDLTAFCADVDARVLARGLSHDTCPLTGCVQCDTLTFRKAG